MAERAPQHRARSLLSDHPRRDVIRRCFNEAAGRLIKGEQRFKLAAQGAVARAGFVEVRLALLRASLQRRVIKLLDLPPAFRRHHAALRSIRAAAMSWPIANRASQYRARLSTPPPSLPRSSRRSSASR